MSLTETKETVTDEAVRDCNMRAAQPGTVLFSFKLSIGKVGVAARSLFTNEAIVALPIKDCGRLDARYLAWALKTMSYFHGANRAVMGATLNKHALENIDIPLPPLDEQRRIVNIFDQADDLRRQRRALLEKLETLPESLLDDMIGRKSHPRVSLSSICTKITDGTHQAPVWEDSGIPFIFVGSIRNQEINFESGKFVSLKTYNDLTKHSPVDIGDILYTTVGSYGNAAAVQTREPFIFQRHIAHLKPINNKINSIFLSQVMESKEIRSQADAAATGVAQKTIILGRLKEFKIRICSTRRGALAPA